MILKEKEERKMERKEDGDKEERIMSLLSSGEGIPLYPDQMMKELKVPESEEGVFLDRLDDMAQRGLLIQTKKKKYALPELLGYLTGRLQGNAKGFGFLIPDSAGEEDIYLSAENLHGAMHHDRIMVRLLKNDGKSREGEVVRVLERANQTVVGTFEKDRRFGFVVPDDKRIGQDIFIAKDDINGARDNYKVVAEILKWPDKRRNAAGRIKEVLGHKDDVGTDILSIIRQYELPEDFPDKVIREAQQIPQTVPEEEIRRRKDLRNMRMVTIDGPDAKDLDDAVSVEPLDNGNFLLGVHIADVSYYVRKNSELDREAYARGTSVYLVDRVIPMLPRELSNGICSLNPKEDRLALSVLMEIDHRGKVVDHRIEESVIRSSERMVYEDVTKILEENDPELMERYRPLVNDFRNMEILSRILRKKRMRRGSIDFDLDEAKIILNKKGKPVDVRPYERSISNRIIEEFMLVCNETVAEYMTGNEVPFLYRIHEDPTAEKLEEFNELIHNFGYHLKGTGEKIHPKSLQNLLEKVHGTREEGIISAVMLRSLQKARYSSENAGHFGLAAKYYCHYTSPIRRYPDLVVHRIIKDFIHKRMDKKHRGMLAGSLPEAADHCSEREKVADEAEWATEDLKKAEFMADKIGEEYDGIISGVTNYGIYVALDNTVEGLIRMVDLDDDYYVYDEKHYCLIGEHRRKTYYLGDTIRIRVSNVDLAARNVDFVPA